MILLKTFLIGCLQSSSFLCFSNRRETIPCRGWSGVNILRLFIRAYIVCEGVDLVNFRFLQPASLQQ